MDARKTLFGWIPNFLTSLALVSGSLSVFFAIDGHMAWAGILIIVSAVFDFLDGFSARLLKSYSEIGKQLDSLSDVIAFGLAPAAILFTLFEFALFGRNQQIQDINATWYEWAILFSSFLIPVFSAFRLAKFNISTNQDRNFIGLPTPANALLWASFALMLSIPKYTEVLKLLYTAKNLLAIVVITSILLVSRIPMFSLKFKSFSWAGNWYRFIFIGICVILLALLNVYAIPLIFLTYVLSNMVFYLVGINF
jgi:CDP-diacylglycerol---serine O-phosphatidyltransferase